MVCFLVLISPQSQRGGGAVSFGTELANLGVQGIGTEWGAVSFGTALGSLCVYGSVPLGFGRSSK